MKIRISKEDVFAEVQKQSEYIGKKKGNFELVSLTDEDFILLDRFWSDGCDIIVDVVKDFLESKEGDVTFVLSVRNNNAKSIESVIFAIVLNYVLGNWLGVSSPDESEIYFKKASGNGDVLKHLIYQRPVPVKY